MRAEDEQAAWRYFRQIIDETCAPRPQPITDMAVVHDFVAHVYRWPMLGQNEIDDLDRIGHPGTKAARARDQNRPLAHAMMLTRSVSSDKKRYDVDASTRAVERRASVPVVNSRSISPLIPRPLSLSRWDQ